jgi:hypothetical protein
LGDLYSFLGSGDTSDVVGEFLAVLELWVEVGGDVRKNVYWEGFA